MTCRNVNSMPLYCKYHYCISEMSVDNILFYNYRGQLCNAVTRSIRKSYVCDVMAPTHPLLRYKAEICSIEFRAEKQATEEKPLTKREKHIRVDPKTVLCRINLSDGKQFVIRACVFGKLINTNSLLLERKQLLLDEPEWRGHIAVIYRYNKSKNDMQYLTFDDYKEKKSSKMLLCDNLTATFAK
ncbi:FAM206 family protein [Trichinella pseudospiralis]|uniref:FAM206 family protein n=1 Tax=Trichinella pseudospiralis TaxID=6337 RepID=A0A0V1J859_TRIPS|nr:FAM206 family protein [Trichinella pseudospiralis]